MLERKRLGLPGVPEHRGGLARSWERGNGEVRKVGGRTGVAGDALLHLQPGIGVPAVPGAARSHWGIENSVYWVLDVSFRGDENRVRTRNAPANLATMRHAALNLLRQGRQSRISIKAKRKLAAWDNAYLLSILSN